ncbi:MAG: hypothetical protein EOP48_00350 [Sphingobacteriales bacterium]|nr:MAG: hypothetical protein EOP48_00350 [Sphingobacteriales bacterium]
MVKLINKRLKAGSLIEVLVSMIIIMIVFSIASRIYLNSYLHLPALAKVTAELRMESILNDLRTGNCPIENYTDSINYTIDIAPCTFSDSLDIATITANRSGIFVGRKQALILRK